MGRKLGDVTDDKKILEWEEPNMPKGGVKEHVVRMWTQHW